MEDIINRLAEIEAAASNIMEDVTEQKKHLAEQYETSLQEYDRQIDEQMRSRSALIRRELEVKMKAELEKQESKTQTTLNQMDTYYAQCHTQLAQQIYDRILRM